MSFFRELKRRNVIKVAIAYVVLAWLSAQVAELLLETFGAPEWVLKTLLMLLMIGFPFALFFAWAFELTPEGLKKEKEVDRSQSITHETSRKLDFIIMPRLVPTHSSIGAITVIHYIWVIWKTSQTRVWLLCKSHHFMPLNWF